MKTKLLFITLLLVLTVNSQTIETVAGNGTWGFSGDYGNSLNAEIATPLDVDLDSYGNIYFPTWNYRIRKVDTNGIITTIAGDGTDGSTGDGSYAVNAKIGFTKNIAIYNDEIFLANFSPGKVRKINTNGIITTVAGVGNLGHSGDDGLAINAGMGPMDIAFDSSGLLYIAEQNYIRKVDENGIITTIAGNGTNINSGDGALAINAGIHYINHIHIDYNDNIYIADDQDHIIRKIDTNGIITTICGIGTGAFSGDNGPATGASLYSPQNLTSIGDDLYIADYVNKRVRKIDANGIITTYVNGNSGGNLDGELYNLRGLIYKNDAFYLTQSNVVSKITDSQLSISDMQNENFVKIYPNPTSNTITINIDYDANIRIYNNLGQFIFQKNITQNDNVINIDNLNRGLYQIEIITKSNKFYKKIIKK